MSEPIPEGFVRVRSKDDHDVVLEQPLARSALPYFPGWEPIPSDDQAGEATEAPAEAEEDPPPSPPRKTARKGDTAKEGDK